MQRLRPPEYGRSQPSHRPSNEPPMHASTHSVRRTPVALTLAAVVLVLLLAALS